MARYSAVARRSERLRESRRELSRMPHHPRSHGLISDELAHIGHGVGMQLQASPSSVGKNFNGAASGASSPYGGYDHTTPYGWPQQDLPHPAAPVSSIIPHDQYMAVPNPLTPPGGADTPEIIWREPSDAVFCDSSATPSTTPATPSSFGAMEMPKGPYWGQ